MAYSKWIVHHVAAIPGRPQERASGPPLPAARASLTTSTRDRPRAVGAVAIS
jgi:hypothetical protein